MPKKIIAANWKENPRTEAEALKLFKAVAVAQAKAGSNVDVVLCPPFIYLEAIAHAFRKSVRPRTRIALGAQDAFWEETGAFTSEVGPKMLRSLGMSYVILGHSERRKYMKETDATINKKIKLALKDHLKVILCVGEPSAIRKQGMAAAKRFVKNQLSKDLSGVRDCAMIVAYEPLWAIGSGRYDNPDDAAEMLSFIKELMKKNHLKSKTLYGGSVNSKNVSDYVSEKSIDGALVGGASLKAAEFGKMISLKIN